MSEWLSPLIGGAAGALGVVVTHVVMRRRKQLVAAIGSVETGLHDLFDKHAPAWRTCTCDSCAGRRDQAKVPHPGEAESQ